MYNFIVNPNAKGGQGEKLWRRLEKRLAYLGIEYEAFLTTKAGDASVFAANLTKKCREPRIIVIVGGDGIVNEVVDGLCFGGPVTLGYIPTGSGNDLARSLLHGKTAEHKMVLCHRSAERKFHIIMKPQSFQSPSPQNKFHKASRASSPRSFQLSPRPMISASFASFSFL